MIRFEIGIALRYEACEPSTFVLNIQPVVSPYQRIVAESLRTHPGAALRELTHPEFGNRLLRFTCAPGEVRIGYRATVELSHRLDRPENLLEAPAPEIPDSALPYIAPSRYCESDKLMEFACGNFGHLPPGYARVAAIAEWVRQSISFQTGVSKWTTSAMDTLQSRTGVCRDFAHLMIGLCRALNIPARFVSGIDYGADPTLGPPDFHAYVEVCLSGRWYIFDPTGISPTTGLLRIGTGRDAADVPFATIFGRVNCERPQVSIDAVVDGRPGLELPQHTRWAVSTAAAGAIAATHPSAGWQESPPPPYPGEPIAAARHGVTTPLLAMSRRSS